MTGWVWYQEFAGDDDEQLDVGSAWSTCEASAEIGAFRLDSKSGLMLPEGCRRKTLPFGFGNRPADVCGRERLP